MMASAKKTWNTGVISSCLYLQDKCDVRLLGDAVARKARDVYHVIVDTNDAPNGSHGESKVPTETSSDDES
jgi:hypothetical protein